MPARTRRRSTVAAITLTAGITAGAGLLLSACAPDHQETGTAPAATRSSVTSSPKESGKDAQGGTGIAATSAEPTAPSRPAQALVNGTAHNGLTISDGTRYVVMNGARVDFGTAVRDLTWSPDGLKAAFIDGDGDLAVSRPDGGGRVVVAKNPGDENWSHPAWQVRAYDPRTGEPAADNLFFGVRKNGVSKLCTIPATARQGSPEPLSLNRESGENTPSLPQTGNVWPSAAGTTYGTAVYANPETGEVYLRDDYIRQQGSALTKGSEPALSPAKAQDIVFVRSVGGHDHLFLEHDTRGGPAFEDLTPDAATDYTEPAWSPDGSTIAARTPDGVVTLPADGSHAPVAVSGYRGLPAYRA